MSDDLIRVEETRAWLLKAQTDFAAATALCEQSEAFGGIAAYLYQQAAEKALKAVLVWHNQPFSKTHDLTVLLAQATTYLADAKAFQNDAALLTPLATQYRYPGDDDNATITSEELEAAVRASNRIVRLAEKVLAAAIDQKA